MNDLLVGNTSGKNTAEDLVKILNETTSPYHPVKANFTIPIEITGLERFPKVEACKPLEPSSIDLNIRCCLDDLDMKIKNHINKVLVKLLEMCGFDYLFFTVNREDFEIITEPFLEASISVWRSHYKGTPLFEVYRHYGLIENPESFKFTLAVCEEYYLFKNDGDGYYPVKVELDLEDEKT